MAYRCAFAVLLSIYVLHFGQRKGRLSAMGLGALTAVAVPPELSWSWSNRLPDRFFALHLVCAVFCSKVGCVSPILGR